MTGECGRASEASPSVGPVGPGQTDQRTPGMCTASRSPIAVPTASTKPAGAGCPPWAATIESHSTEIAPALVRSTVEASTARSRSRSATSR